MAVYHVILSVVVISLVELSTAQSDLTLQEKSSGSAVVQAVIDRIRESCIYTNDRLLLRRLALVQSDDGKMSTTYRTGYDGGIWQINEEIFNKIQNCNQFLNGECNIMKSAFNISWSAVQWRDLRKPMYSGLAATLYLKLQGFDPAPGNLTEQASIWKSLFQPSGREEHYKTKVTQAEMDADDSCDYKPIDIVFIIDESGSVSYTDFQKTLQFLAMIVDKLTIGLDATQVGLVKFNSRATLQFKLGTYSTKETLKQAILSTPRRSGGTSISAGIQMADKNVFPESQGGRKDATKIAILVTDGQSSLSATKMAADAAKANKIVIFSVGVGYVNMIELESASSEPNCTHVSVLSNFDEIDNIIYEIKKSACRASKPVSGGESVVGAVPGEDGTTIVVDTEDGKNKTIITEVTCGVMNVYTSFSTSHPNQAFYDQKDFAVHGSPSVLEVNTQGKGPLYVTFARTEPDPSCPNSSYTGSVSDEPPENTGTEVICKLNGQWSSCDSDKVVEDDDVKDICGGDTIKDWNTFSNPCTKGGPVYMSHPTDRAKYITCDADQRMYISQCPVGALYDRGISSCNFAHNMAVGSNTQTGAVDLLDTFFILCRVNGKLRKCENSDLESVQEFYDKLCEGVKSPVVSPCNPCAISKIQLVHPHPSDDNKLVTCEEDGSYYVTQCPSGQRYSVAQRKCISYCTIDDIVSTTPSSKPENPCTAEAIAAGKFYFPFEDDNSKYIQCDESGNMFVKSCPNGTIWSVDHTTCIKDNSETVTSTCSCNGEIVNTTPSSEPENPCTAEAIAAGNFYFPFEDDKTKFIQCDAWGNMYIMPCGPGTIWSVVHTTCVKDNSETVTTTSSSNGDIVSTTPSSKPENPCTAEAIAAGKFYFPFEDDNTKFIQCDAWGNMYIMPCGPGTIWSVVHTTCVKDNSETVTTTCSCNGEIVNTPPSSEPENPCTAEAIAARKFYFPLEDDNTKFIQCDAWGNMYIKSCRSGTIWSVHKTTCVHI